MSWEVAFMRKRYCISAGIMAAFVCLALAVLAALPPGPGVTKVNVDRIEEGIRLDEVEAILGRTADGDLSIHEELDGDIQAPMWLNSDKSCAIVVLRDGTVTSARWHESTETLTQRVRRWLHLQQ
jgi:hypothetical protein